MKISKHYSTKSEDMEITHLGWGIYKIEEYLPRAMDAKRTSKCGHLLLVLRGNVNSMKQLKIHPANLSNN